MFHISNLYKIYPYSKNIIILCLILLSALLFIKQYLLFNNIVNVICTSVSFIGLFFCFAYIKVDKDSERYITYKKQKVDRYIEYVEYSNHIETLGKPRWDILNNAALKINDLSYNTTLKNLTTKFEFSSREHLSGTMDLFVEIPEINKSIPEYAQRIIEKKLEKEKISLKITRVIYK